jgi:energy-coupling factor transporter ATP-binding protein EcfA2
MQLAGIKISNLFSFPYISDLKLAQEVVFHNIGKNNVNVLIGPNGAGKSKFLDVITKIWKVAFMKDYMVSKQLFDSEDPEKLKSVIIENPVLLEKTYPHFNSPEKPSEVIIRFTLTEHDYDNLRFLCEHGDEINALIKKYSTINFAFSAMCIDDLVLDESTMTFHCILDIPHKSVSIDRTGLSQIKLFVLDYLIRIELIQICIDLRNMFTDSESWGSLRNTIAFIGFDRSLENISSKISPGIWERLVFEKAHKKYSAYAGYYLCAKKIWHIITSAKGTLTPAAVQNKLAQSDFFTSFTAIIQKYINKTLTVKYAT